MSKNKTGAKKCIIDGIKFDSKAEGARYQMLKRKEKAGLIKNLELQKRYDLCVNSLKVCAYIADFVYEHRGKTVVEDVKGMIQAAFKLKFKLMFACHGIELLITQAVYATRGGVSYITGFKVNDTLRLPTKPKEKGIKSEKRKTKQKGTGASRRIENKAR